MTDELNIRKSVNWDGKVKRLHLLMVLALVASLVMSLTAMPTAVQAKKDDLKADPRLLQLAAEHPDDVFKVIVQRDVKNKDLPDENPEAAVANGGGRVKKQLQMIESFSAELTGKEIEKLARHKKVRWISLDAPMFSTGTFTFSVVDMIQPPGLLHWKRRGVQLEWTVAGNRGSGRCRRRRGHSGVQLELRIGKQLPALRRIIDAQLRRPRREPPGRSQ